MLTDWIHWLSCRHADELLVFLWALLLTDLPRYSLAKIVMCLWDCGRSGWLWLCGDRTHRNYTYCPSVSVVIAGYNESKTIEATLLSIWASYPWLEIIVVDDGSTDTMAAVVRDFATTHDGVLVLRRPQRGGKSSAMNFAVQYSRADIIISVDADSHLGPGAIWEIVQPFSDPTVGAVSAAVLSRNPFTNVLTWLQAYEYLHSIFVGRMVSARLGILGIGSGALTAFRRIAFDQTLGWDVAPGEDLDLTLRIRKSGFKIAYAPYAQCFTNVPSRWWALIKQRMRWERSGTVRMHCRKHIDMAYFWSRNFRVLDFFVLLESWLFTLILPFVIAGWLVWFCFNPPDDWARILAAIYLCYLAFEVVQIATSFYYSNNLRRDAVICAVFPLAPLYQFLLLGVRIAATLEELLFRKSFDDNFSPERVRNATWRW